MQDPQHRLVGVAQFAGQAVLVGVGRRQRQHSVGVTARVQRIDHRRCLRVITDDQPGELPGGSGRGECGLLPVNRVARIGERLNAALPIVLGSKLSEHIGCRLIAIEQCREFVDPAVLEKTDRVGAAGSLRDRRPDGCALVVVEPILAVLKGVGGQVHLVCRLGNHSAELGQVSGDVGTGESLGDLAVVGDVAAQ
jgi:hypothetical protein